MTTTTNPNNYAEDFLNFLKKQPPSHSRERNNFIGEMRFLRQYRHVTVPPFCNRAEFTAWLESEDSRIDGAHYPAADWMWREFCLTLPPEAQAAARWMPDDNFEEAQARRNIITAWARHIGCHPISSTDLCSSNIRGPLKAMSQMLSPRKVRCFLREMVGEAYDGWSVEAAEAEDTWRLVPTPTPDLADAFLDYLDGGQGRSNYYGNAMRRMASTIEDGPTPPLLRNSYDFHRWLRAEGGTSSLFITAANRAWMGFCATLPARSAVVWAYEDLDDSADGKTEDQRALLLAWAWAFGGDPVSSAQLCRNSTVQQAISEAIPKLTAAKLSDYIADMGGKELSGWRVGTTRGRRWRLIRTIPETPKHPPYHPTSKDFIGFKLTATGA